MNTELWDRLWKTAPFLIYKTKQKDKDLKSTNAGKIMIIVCFVWHLLLAKCLKLFPSKPSKFLNILMYMCAHTEFKTELKKWQFPSG